MINVKAQDLEAMRFDLAEINYGQDTEVEDAIPCAGVTGVRRALGAKDRVFGHRGAEFTICLPGKTHTEYDASREKLLAALAANLNATPELAPAALHVQYGIASLELDALIGQ